MDTMSPMVTKDANSHTPYSPLLIETVFPGNVTNHLELRMRAIKQGYFDRFVLDELVSYKSVWRGVSISSHRVTIS